MNSQNVIRNLAIFGVSVLMTACSAESNRLSQQKSEVDDQKNAQVKLIDDRTAELKQNIDLNLRRQVDSLDAMKHEPGADKSALDARSNLLKNNASAAKNSLDQQNKECKATVDRNVKNLKAELDAQNKSN